MAWNMDLGGTWICRIEGMEAREARLPGTLDENGIGFPDQGANQWNPGQGDVGWNAEGGQENVIRTRLTRCRTYEGPAVFTREITLAPGAGERVFLFAERSRKASLRVNGAEARPTVQGTVSTPWEFEITALVRPGTNVLSLTSDNSYPGWPRDAIVFSSAATDETQTNWSGFLGRLELRGEMEDFIAAVRAYPFAEAADVEIELDLAKPRRGVLTLASEAFAASAQLPFDLPAGRHTLRARGIALAADVRRWDEEEGNLCTLTAGGAGLEEKSVRFGVRTFAAKEGRLALNGRVIFLRSEANCCVFPETGHMPMTVGEWKEVLGAYRAYGVNCMRFHSHTPPEAAFCAADEMGMLMEPELSHWNPRTAFEDEESWAYYSLEMRQILLALANHPSFVMLTFGNELSCGALGTRRMTLLLNQARALDPTRLYEEASNPFLGLIGPNPQSGFFTGMQFCGDMLRGTSAGMAGHINQEYPCARRDFSAQIARLRREYEGPVFGFEVGQFEVLPDFAEWDGHKGVTRPDNYRWIESQVRLHGFEKDWKRRVEATGELSLIGYREEVEAILRTPEMSGISLLGLQDFPGQGTALVGMLNAHLQPKPYPFARPERFRAFFRPAVPLALLEKYTYTNAETMCVPVRFANYSRTERAGEAVVRLMRGVEELAVRTLPGTVSPVGALSDLGEAMFPLEGIPVPARLDLEVSYGGETNRWPVWVYAENAELRTGSVTMAREAGEALAALRRGEKVLLTPPADEDHFPDSVQAQFTTDFWSVGTFPTQSGFMGLMLEPGHAAFASFPTESHTNWQWWPMCRGRAFRLPEGKSAIVTGLDCYARMRSLAMLMEAGVGNGRLVLSGMGLLEMRRYPEARALLRSILDYMDSPLFAPEQELTEEQLVTIVR